jgi:opacity protein-like surface antigen
MKKILLICAAIALVSTQLFAAGPISFGVQATGANLNFDDPNLKEVYGFGFGGGVHLDINLPLILAIRAQGDYVTFGLDNAKYQALLSKTAAGLGFQTNPSDFSVDGGRINILSVNINGKLSPLPLPLISPYVTAGGGIASVSTSDLTVKYQGSSIPGGTVPGAKAETNASANVGVGVDLDLIALKLYLEARYTWIFASGATSTYIPVSLGVTF